MRQRSRPSTTSKKRSSSACALILLPLLGGSTGSAATKVELEEPAVIPLEQGTPAPYPGFLFPPGRALKLGAKLEACQFQLKMDRELFDQTLALRMGAVNDAADIRVGGAEVRADAALQALEDYKTTHAREWWDQPMITFWSGVGAGVVVTAVLAVGSVWAVGELRPAIPSVTTGE